MDLDHLADTPLVTTRREAAAHGVVNQGDTDPAGSKASRAQPPYDDQVSDPAGLPHPITEVFGDGMKPKGVSSS